MHRNPIFLFLLFFSLSNALSGQINSVGNKTDSAKVYRKIETYSKKGGFTNFIYKLFLRPVDTNSSNPLKKKKRNIQKAYKYFEGKIIRRIEIITLDPFGYSVDDTNVIVQNNIYRAGNRLHLKTQEITIRNLLLIHKNDIYDSLYLKESERLIRSQKYVQSVSFYSVLASKNSDSVDIFIRVLDLWSIIPGGSISPTRLTFELSDKNFFGLGHDFHNAFAWNHSNGNNAFNSNYTIPNIRNTYINSSIHYGINENKNFVKSINIERPFFSTFAKWAAGVYLDQQSQKDTILQRDPLLISQDIKYNTQDYWGGTSLQIFKGNSEEERTTNLIMALRLLRKQFFVKPDDYYDSLHIYSNENFYLTGIGLSTRNYVQDKYIFNYGFIEDVPVGKVYELTGGYQVKNNKGRVYLGLRYSIGNYYNWGYLSTNIEYGTFFFQSKSEQSAFSAELNYFTELFEIGKWKFRQFVKPRLVLGFNRFTLDNLSINNEQGIPGFRSNLLSGTQKAVLTLQTQSYAPWNIIGFRFGPYLTCSLGMLGDELNGFRKRKIYSQFGFGVLIKNEFLVFNIIQISAAFYPSIPGSGDNILKINPDKTSDFGFQNFEIGKPVPIDYR